MQLRVGRKVFGYRIVIGRDAHAPSYFDRPWWTPTRGIAVYPVEAIAAHANHPCSIQPSRSPTLANAQARCPCAVSTT